MEIIDDVVKKLTDAADITIKGAEKLTESAKQRLTLIEEEGRLKNLYAALGKRYYDEASKSGEIPAEYAETFGEISEKQKKIAELKAAQQAAKENCTLCPGCKSKVEKGAAYCKVCGLKQN